MFRYGGGTDKTFWKSTSDQNYDGKVQNNVGFRPTRITAALVSKWSKICEI